MRQSDSFATIAATFFAGVFMLALVLIAPGLVLASEPASTRQPTPQVTPDLRATLDDSDEVATLDAVHIALSQVADGGTYVWQRLHGRLSAVLQPTQSFKDQAGQVCRHLMIRLTSGPTTRQTEGIACRLPDGRWQLDG
jgi:hypothetical protein